MTTKRGLFWLLLAVGFLFLLCIPDRSVGPPVHRQDRSVLSQSGFASTWCRALRATTPAFLHNRAGPWEFFMMEFGFRITDIEDDGPRWWEYRGPPGPNARSSQDLVTSCKAAGQAGSLEGSFPAKFRGLQGQIQNSGFFNSL